MAVRIIPFPKAAVSSPRGPESRDAHLLRAAKAAYSALLLAVPHGEKNTVVKKLGDAIRAFETLEPPPPKLTGAVAAQLLHELHSAQCSCGREKEARKPFCRTCYFALPNPLRASMWLSPVDDGDHLLDRFLQAKAHLRRVGVHA